MDKPKNSSFKSLEVIWNRNTSTHKPKLLPELKGINIEDSVEKVKNSAKSPDVKINKNKIEHVHKRVKRSLFQETENEKLLKNSDPAELNKEPRETFDYANSLRKRTYSIYKASQLNCPTKSPQIVSNRKNIIRNQYASLHKSKQCLFPTKSSKTEFSSSHVVNDPSVIKPSCSKDQLNSHTNVFGYSKSPEIMSNRKRQVMFKNLDMPDDLSHDRLNMNYKCVSPKDQSPEKLNEKSKNINTHINKIESKLSSVHSEDIIESSEKVITPFKKKKKKKNRIRSKKTKIKNCTNRSKASESPTFTNRKNEINFDSIDIINTGNMLVSPIIESKIKSYCREPKQSIVLPKIHQHREPAELCTINDDSQRYSSNNSLTHSSLNTKEFAKNAVKEEHPKILTPHRAKMFIPNEDNIISFKHSSEVNLIPATPEHDAINVQNSKFQYSPETILSPYVPLIEVDQSPKTPHGKNCQVLIQTVQTPLNVEDRTLPGLFEPIASPTPSFFNNELPFKIDSIESPKAIHENDIIFSPKINRRKSDNSPSSPNCFDSAKKRKKMNKDGLKGKFQDLINRKKSEARIREYEKSLSKSYKPKQGESALLKVIEAWKEFRTIVLLCYYMESDKKVQRVLVTLDNCPINAAKNSIIRIYSPWLTIKSEITEVLLFIGIIHAEVIELPESITKPLELVEGFAVLNELATRVFQNKVLWKCNCSKDAACQCLGELSVYNYLQHMIPY